MNSSVSSTVSACRLCGSPTLEKLLDLGDQPPANALRSINEDAPQSIPLILCRCSSCGTIQLSEDVEPEFLFSKYLWVTGTSKGANIYSKLFADRALMRCPKDRPLSILEIASNDGTFLRVFADRGHHVLGVDPASNLALLATQSGLNTLPSFFNTKTAESIYQSYGSFDLVYARNVIPHVPCPNDVINGIAKCLSNDGTGVIEFHWAGLIIEELHYDSIYHEHYFYHTLASLEELLRRHSLYVYDVDESPISGGSLVVYFSRTKLDPSPLLNKYRHIESEKSLGTPAPWKDFAVQSYEHKKQLLEIIKTEKSRGLTICGYGASARSSTMLNFCGIDNQYITCIADQNQLKHGLYTAGTNIPVCSPDDMLNSNPDIILILAWNFKDEILDELRRRNFKGHILLPLPGSPKLLEL